jgi:hypothetical protein
MDKVIISCIVAIVLLSAGAGAINAASDRSFERGRAVGKCDVVLMLDAAMRKKDPKFSAPDGLIARCKTLTKDKTNAG